jgi:hypothetical protein
MPVCAMHARALPVCHLRATARNEKLSWLNTVPAYFKHEAAAPEGEQRRFATPSARVDNKVVSRQDPSTSNERRKPYPDQNVRPISGRAVAIFFAVLVAIFVFGYLLMTNLADDSRAENCMMEHRKNCGAIEWPSK